MISKVIRLLVILALICAAVSLVGPAGDTLSGLRWRFCEWNCSSIDDPGQWYDAMGACLGLE